jgi:hypothetical protein
MHHERSDTHTHARWYTVPRTVILAHVVCEGILTCYIHSNPIMMQTSFSCVEDSRLSRYSTTTRPLHLHHELSMPWLVRQRAEAELAHADPSSLIAELALVWASTAPRVFSVNSVPRVASGTARLCSSFTDMPFSVKVKVPSLKGLFSSSKKRPKAQCQAAPEVQSAVPDR